MIQHKTSHKRNLDTKEGLKGEAKGSVEVDIWWVAKVNYKSRKNSSVGKTDDGMH